MTARMSGMWLPVPSKQGIDSFRELVHRELGIEMNDEDAREVATRVLQIHLMKLYEDRHLRSQVE